MERDKTTQRPDRSGREEELESPDEAAEAEVSERAVEPHQPTYPPATEVGETVEPEDSREERAGRFVEPTRESRAGPGGARDRSSEKSYWERSTMERVNDALHRAGPEGAEEGR